MLETALMRWFSALADWCNRTMEDPPDLLIVSYALLAWIGCTAGLTTDLQMASTVMLILLAFRATMARLNRLESKLAGDSERPNVDHEAMVSRCEEILDQYDLVPKRS